MRVQISGCFLIGVLLAGCQTTQSPPLEPQPQILMPVGSSSTAPATVREDDPTPTAPSTPDLRDDESGGGGGGWG